ncbi:MAG TPA: hypothetical protein VKU39_15350 [Streptosporangiaceae bacterium]|nr:hypothetical protein [Streptosporangiaceae bacterium]
MVSESHSPVWRMKDGHAWRIGTDADVAWIVGGTSPGLAITSAIPPVFEAYATIVLPSHDDDQEEYDRAVLAVMSTEAVSQPWWLGYLDTGPDDIVFPDAPMVTLYSGWHYVLAAAGPEQAGTWRVSGPYRDGVLPSLMFPADRSWLMSTLWDDDWTCVGGSARVVSRLVNHPVLRARPVELGEDATPPGHQAF